MQILIHTAERTGARSGEHLAQGLTRQHIIQTRIALRRELTKPAGRPILHRSVIVGRNGASARHRLCEFQKSWHRPGVVPADILGWF